MPAGHEGAGAGGADRRDLHQLQPGGRPPGGAGAAGPAPAARPTALFAGADVVAMGVLEALADAGLSVPGDLSVAGYDNTTFAAFGPVSLTSVDQAGREMGRNAVRLLLDRIADHGRPSAKVTLSPTLVTRRSTARLAE
ncbi:substrate-binding domain-containing protein [Streptomyces scabiei]|uniref:substrate-binding domain-containing protein n=1 Tax=Streptomyces scabiei TaxID=1930 RepID=UPI0035AB9738